MTDEKGNSLFAQVLKRRNSRKSTETWCNIDFDYAGDSSKYNHLIERRKDLGMPNTEQLNFEMNLRNYKNVCEYYAPRPWIYPPVRSFNPAKHLERQRNDVNLLNPEFKTKYYGRFGERNVAYILN
jgi:hypothetical protein